MALKNSYLPFARKYRPSNFQDLLGQDVLVKTLAASIQEARLAQAYLLTGIRGIGKTSSARIIAKTVNCTNPKHGDKALSKDQVIPCEECENCKNFNSGNHPDIMEMDAASKTGIDEIRSIISSSEYLPLLGKIKFFIIDEVHMLSKSAFNALLKLLEEPPAHVIFILVTTEIQKIPLTVISRCHRFDLHRLQHKEIIRLLKHIAQIEKIDLQDDAARIIAEQSQGSARDATMMLDQATSFSHHNQKEQVISVDIINQMLGLVSNEVIIKFVDLIINNSAKEAIALIEKIYNESSSLEIFLSAVADFFVELSKAKIIKNYKISIYTEHTKEISELILNISLAKASILQQIFSKSIHDMKHSHNELVTAQMLVIKAIYANNIPDIPPAGAMTPDTKTSTIQSKQFSDAPVIIPSTNQSDILKLADNKSLKQIIDFLKYCYDKQEMHIYYLLFNKSEIKILENNIMEITSQEKITESVGQITKLLHSWLGNAWKVKYKKTSAKVFSCKDIIQEQLKKGTNYSMIRKIFPEAQLSEILLDS